MEGEKRRMGREGEGRKAMKREVKERRRWGSDEGKEGDARGRKRGEREGKGREEK